MAVRGKIDVLKELNFSPAYIRSRLFYDPETGAFVWRRGQRAGAVAGYAMNGKYWLINLGKKNFYGHRLAWVLVTGEWPKNQVDHIDFDGLNNRWKNLREATRQQNTVHSRAYRTNHLGVKGVRRTKAGKFITMISFDGWTYYLGTFSSVEEASNAYLAAAEEVHGKNWVREI